MNVNKATFWSFSSNPRNIKTEVVDNNYKLQYLKYGIDEEDINLHNARPLKNAIDMYYNNTRNEFRNNTSGVFNHIYENIFQYMVGFSVIINLIIYVAL